VVRGVLDDGVSFVVIDSLNAYLQAMPGQSFLLLHMHELVTFLNQQGVMTVLVVGQHGLVGDMRSDIDLSYLSDSILLFRYFESQSEMRTAISAVKSRTGENRRTVHELRLAAGVGVKVGEVLDGFDSVLGGVATYRGNTPMLTGNAN
jgi:circadian clock protein KaiC